jgi:hypothetical protein
MKRAIQGLLVLVVLVAGGLGAYNVFADAEEIQQLGEKAACQGIMGTCQATMTRMSRNPLWSDMHVRVREDNVEVRCQRAFYLLGERTCTKQAESH